MCNKFLSQYGKCIKFFGVILWGSHILANHEI
eukprot:UN13699